MSLPSQLSPLRAPGCDTKKEQRKANLRGGTSTSSTARGADSTAPGSNPANNEGELVDNVFASVAGSSAGNAAAAAGIAGAAATPGSDPAQRQQSRPYEALLAGSIEKFENGGATTAAVRAGVRPATSGGTRNNSGRRRPLSSGPASRSKPFAGARDENNSSGNGNGNSGGCGEHEGGGAAAREERRLEKERQARKKARPRTACAGSGGVQGVLARMGGYEKVRTRLACQCYEGKRQRMVTMRWLSGAERELPGGGGTRKPHCLQASLW